MLFTTFEMANTILPSTMSNEREERRWLLSPQGRISRAAAMLVPIFGLFDILSAIARRLRLPPTS